MLGLAECPAKVTAPIYLNARENSTRVPSCLIHMRQYLKVIEESAMATVCSAKPHMTDNMRDPKVRFISPEAYIQNIT
jgi:hypothetical protein